MLYNLPMTRFEIAFITTLLGTSSMVGAQGTKVELKSAEGQSVGTATLTSAGKDSGRRKHKVKCEESTTRRTRDPHSPERKVRRPSIHISRAAL